LCPFGVTRVCAVRFGYFTVGTYMLYTG
jgi:hypothetical protein